MALARFADGIQLEYDEQLFSVAQPTAAARGPGGRRRGFSEAPQPLAGAPATGGAAAAIAERLRARGVVHRVAPPIQIGAGPAAPDRRRAAPAPAKPTRLTVPVAEGEQAVVLVEGDGVLAWRYGREAPASALATRRRDAPGAARLLEFDIGQPPVGVGEPPAGDLRRGWLRDRLVEGVRAIVLYFAAEATATAVVKLLERGRREGPVLVTSTDATEWRQPDDFSGVALPGDRQARVLLLVHGTFSSTVGGFGELGATPWGQRLLSSALQRYDAVLGFDHRSLSRTPRENAHALLQALGTLRSAHGIVADAVCHSRGGLVLRSLIEQELPASGLGLQVERAIFVAATNHGTELARPENWETLVDLLTNLGSVSAQALALFAPPAALAARIADEVFDCIGDFVKYLVQVAVKERRAPGIAAMDPGGDFVKELNERQPGQPSPAQLACYAVVSDFYAKLFDNGEHEPREMPKRLAFILADGVVDRLMRGDQAAPVPNDLVVDVASMTDIDRAVGGYVRDVLDYGRNPLVYHTNYFLRPETAARLAQWLKLPSPLDERVRQTLDGGQHSGLLRLPATAPMAEVRRRIESEAPNYLVFERQHPAAGARGRLYYALTPDEIRRAAAAADDWVPAEHALAFAETRASTAVDAGAAPTDRRGPPPADTAPSSRRGVVLAGRQVRAVLESDSQALGSAALARLATAALPSTTGSEAPLPEAAGAPRRTRGPGAAARKTAARKTAAARPTAPTAPARVDTYVTAEMPREVRQGSQALVTVTLSAEQIEAAAGSASAAGRVSLARAPVTVMVLPRQGFDYIGDGSDCEQQVEPPTAGAPVVLDFKLLARDTGPGEVMVALRQGAQRLLTLTLRATVVDAAARPTRASTAASAAAPAGDTPECGLCPTLEIFDRRGPGSLRYEFILRADGVNNRYLSAEIKSDPQAYVDARYTEIENAWTGSQRASDRFNARLQAIGATMARQLFPPELRRALWKLVEAGALDDILVYSDEPFLPWEVVFLDDPAAPAATGRGRFLGELGLCRWLYGAVPTCEIRVRRGGARYVVPHYPDPQWRLQAAEDDEEPMLVRELGATALAPTHEAVLAALSTPGSFDLLHFACHGEADAADIDGAALLLQGELLDSGWAKETLLAPVVDQTANLRGADGNRPLVVVNACQTGRIGYSMSRLGGFAPAFLGAREGEAEATGKAGAFVGALWSVGDFAASTFVHELYRQLKAGKPMAQAVRDGRAKARSAGEGTWLAYTVYAHPHLRLRFG